MLLLVSDLFASDEDIAFIKKVAKNPNLRKEDKAFAEQINGHLDLEKFKKIAEEVQFLVDKLPETGESCESCNGSKEVEEESKERVKGQREVLVFVSFSMPDMSLIQLNDQLSKYNATLVMRGIYKNSFRETKEKIMKMSKDGLSIRIDPALFKFYGVKRVPTFILVEGNKEVHRLSGNVNLEYAVDKLLKGEDK